MFWGVRITLYGTADMTYLCFIIAEVIGFVVSGIDSLLMVRYGIGVVGGHVSRFSPEHNSSMNC